MITFALIIIISTIAAAVGYKLGTNKTNIGKKKTKPNITGDVYQIETIKKVTEIPFIEMHSNINLYERELRSRLLSEFWDTIEPEINILVEDDFVRGKTIITTTLRIAKLMNKVKV